MWKTLATIILVPVLAEVAKGLTLFQETYKPTLEYAVGLQTFLKRLRFTLQPHLFKRTFCTRL
ncbi:hypothetical protein CSV71_02150 [Sporosarcina sp. P21c]|nr:hypothetical protein CSV71_02150 [Sporosarcina sp. P21c]